MLHFFFSLHSEDMSELRVLHSSDRLSNGIHFCHALTSEKSHANILIPEARLSWLGKRPSNWRDILLPLASASKRKKVTRAVDC
jgi:hypothetical protein